MVIPHLTSRVGSLFLSFFLFFALFNYWQSAAGNAGAPPPYLTSADEKNSASQISRSYGQLPLRFEANRGQFGSQARFVARSQQMSLALTDGDALFQLRQKGSVRTVRMKLLDANPAPRVRGLEAQPGRSHYFVSDARQTEVISYARVRQEAVYPGIDLDWYGNGQRIEHDFIVAPGADVERIRVAFTGAQALRIDRHGDLVLNAGDAELRLLKPAAWQEMDGERHVVDCRFLLNEKQQIRFEVGEYDARQSLVIDPILIYATYFGGTDYDTGLGIAVDQAGNAYIAGETFSPLLPGQTTRPNSTLADAFVTKLNRDGTAVIYTTYLGGAGSDSARAIAIDTAGNAYIAGTTTSTDFPKTAGSFSGASEAFVTKLNSKGDAIVYSRLLNGGGTDEASGLAVTATGEAYITGRTDSSDFAATGFQTSRHGSPAYKTSDGGNNWAGAGNGLSGTSVNAFAIDPTDSRIIYAATTAGVFKSTDGGNNWQFKVALPAPILPLNVYDLAIHPANPARIFASTTNGIFRSDDGGETWTLKSDGLNNATGYPGPIKSLLIHPGDPATIYAASNPVFRSADHGETWQNLGYSFPGGSLSAPSKLALVPTTPTTLYFGAHLGVAKSVNGGGTWTIVLRENVAALAIDPQTPNTIYVGSADSSVGIFKTIDGGASWIAINDGLRQPGATSPPRITALVIDPASPMTIYAGTAAGVFKSLNGGSNWSQSNTGMGDASVSALTIDPRATTTLYTGSKTSTDAFVAKLDMAGALSFLTYLGGAGDDAGRGVAVDAAGNAYVVGVTGSANFPTRNPVQAALNGTTDAFIVKLSATGKDLLYGTFLGGEVTDEATAVAVNAAGNAYVTGITQSFFWPTVSPLVQFRGGMNGFVAKLSVNGQALDYSSILGGRLNDVARGIAVDSRGIAYVTGGTNSTDFPVKDAGQLTQGVAFVTAVNASGDALVYSVRLNTGSDGGGGIAIGLDVRGNAYITGTATTLDIPNATRFAPAGPNAFIAKVGVELDMALAQTASRNPVMTGNSLTYVLSLSNSGPSIATNTIITDQLPPSVSFVSATPTQGSCTHSSGVVTCQLGTLAARASASVTLVVTPNAIGNITNMARVNSGEPDYDDSNNQTTLTVRVSNLPSIAGRIVDAAGKAVAGVALNLTGAQTATQTSGVNGFYQFADVPLGGSLTVTPASNLYSFEPPSRDFANVTGDRTADFTAAACTYSLSTASQSFSSVGGSGTFAVTAPPRCPWTATPTVDWLSVTQGATGAGNGTVQFTVASTATARRARVEVAGQAETVSYAVFQEFSSCDAPRFGTATYGLEYSPSDPVTADFNGDGNNDLALSGQLFNGNGTGRFAPPVNLPAWGSSAKALDLNGDGKVDLAFLGGNPASLLVLYNDGAGTFSAPRSFELVKGPPGFTYASQIFAGEFNRDGQRDMIIRNSSGSPSDATLLLGVGQREFGDPVQLSFNEFRISGVADLNNDGNSDLLLISESSFSHEVRVLVGDGIGGFGQPIASSITGFVRRCEFDDFNGDGNLDAALLVVIDTITANSYSVALLLGDGTGRFAAPTLAKLDDQSLSLFVRDFNGDAKPDILSRLPGRLSVFLGDGAGKLSPAINVAVPPAFDLGAGVTVDDFNNDGRPDVLKGNYDGRSFSVHLNRCGGGHYISGRITDRILTRNALAGVTVKLGGAQTATVQTDSGGNYEFSGLGGGDYAVTPERGGFAFAPDKQSFFNLTVDQVADFNGIRQATAVSAASFKLGPVAPDSIAALFGVELATTTEVATTLPLPFILGETIVRFRAASGAERSARLFFASPGQINLLVPPEMPLGTANLTVGGYAGTPFSLGTVEIEAVAPGVFSADATGQGLAAAVVLRIRQDGSQVYEPVTRFDAAQNRIVAVPIDLDNAGDQVFLLLFGTGFRRRAATSTPLVKIGGVETDVQYAGPQGSFSGLDQINVALPRALMGRGEVEIIFTVENKSANAVKVSFK